MIICCPKSVYVKFENITPNITFYDIADDGVDHYRILRDLYLGCKAILIPINQSNHVPNGATVFAEGLAARKAIVITDLISNFVDVEALNIGYKAKLHAEYGKGPPDGRDANRCEFFSGTALYGRMRHFLLGGHVPAVLQRRLPFYSGKFSTDSDTWESTDVESRLLEVGEVRSSFERNAFVHFVDFCPK